MKESNHLKIIAILVIVLLVLVLLCCVSFFVFFSKFSHLAIEQSITNIAPINATSQVQETPQAQIHTPIPQSLDLDQAAEQTWLTLNQAHIPEGDPIDLAERLGGKQNVPETLIDTEAPHAVGAKKSFWIMDTDTANAYSIDATLHYVGDHIYFWVQDKVKFRQNSLESLGNIIDKDIVPTNRAFFGVEWNPGVDGDERFYVLYAKGIGRTVAGYYSSSDEVHPDAHPFSNAHEMFLLSADNVRLEDSYILGTIAHEYQHMIHWYLDKNEEAWVNEGFSMLAEQVNGYDAGGFDWNYMQKPDMQLNTWDESGADNSAHYGASYLFMSYYLDRFGEEATRALVAHKENGFAAMDEVSKELGLINPDSGEPYTGVEIFADWTVANLLQNTGIQDKRYDYQSYSPYSLKITENIHSCPESINRDVHQFVADYIEVLCDKVNEMTVQGEAYSKILPFDKPFSGDYFWWSNAGDESNMSLQQEFDFTDVSGENMFTFWMWHDIERDYDYVYLTASTDGENWTMLHDNFCDSNNSSGNNYGCGWTGKSMEWRLSSVDLSQYNGQKVTLRFDYVTDAAVHGDGLALDNFRIDAINYDSDLEEDGGGWVGEGFVRIQNVLPQKYVVSLLRYGDTTVVEHHFVNGNEPLTIQLEKSPNQEKIIIIVSGATIGTRQKADYKIQFKE